MRWLRNLAGGLRRLTPVPAKKRSEQETGDHRTEAELQDHQQTAEFLREALQLFRQVTDNIAEVFWVTDPSKTRVEFVSPEFEKVWGEARKTLYAAPSTWLERIHEQDRERVREAMLARQVTGGYDEQYRVVRTDGSVRWVRDRAFPVKDEAGAVYRIVGIAEDITERKRTEQILQVERDIGVALASTSDLSVALQRLLEIAIRLEGIECGGVYLRDPETAELRLEAHRGMPEPLVKHSPLLKADSLGAAITEGTEAEGARRAQIPHSLELLWASEGLRSLAIVPLQYKGDVLGVLNLAAYRQNGIFPETRVAIETIASQIAGAIVRIRTEESLRRSEAHVRSVVNSAPIALLATDAAGRITFEDGRALKAIGATPGLHIKREVREIYQEDPVMLQNFERACAGEEVGCLVQFGPAALECQFTPIRDREGQPAGCIAVALDVTERIRLEREILEISDREQARIGQDIHDGLCQQLIGMAFSANSLEQALASQQRPEVGTARKVCSVLDEAITESRRVCRGLYPVRLRKEGLVPALEDLAQTVSERYSVRCRFETDGRRLHCKIAAATHLYRIAQEAVNNAIKHSGGRNIVVRTSRGETGIELSIQDDGKGLKNEPKGEGGMGLHIMDYRARTIGGTLQITSTEGGTTVTCRAKLEGGDVVEAGEQT